MKSQTIREFKMVNGKIYHHLYNLKLKVYRGTKNDEYLNECWNKKLLPQFTFISKLTMKLVSWNKLTIRNKRFEILLETMKDQIERNITNTNKFNIYINTLIFLSNRFIKKLINFIDFEIKNAQFNNDQKRNNKLKNFKNPEQKNEEIKIFNISNL